MWVLLLACDLASGVTVVEEDEVDVNAANVNVSVDKSNTTDVEEVETTANVDGANIDAGAIAIDVDEVVDVAVDVTTAATDVDKADDGADVATDGDGMTDAEINAMTWPLNPTSGPSASSPNVPPPCSLAVQLVKCVPYSWVNGGGQAAER